MKKSRGVLILVLTVIVTALLIFTSAVGWGPYRNRSRKKH